MTFRLLQETHARQGGDAQVLDTEIGEYKRILETKWRGYASDDPLDSGMTLWTAHWFDGEEEWAMGLVSVARRDLEQPFDEKFFERSTRYRLAFRESGTCLGIGCAMHGAKWNETTQQVMQECESDGLVPKPSGPSAGRNSMKKFLPISLVMYASAVSPSGERTLSRPRASYLCVVNRRISISERLSGSRIS